MAFGYNWPWEIDGFLSWVWHSWSYEGCRGFRLLGLDIMTKEESHV